MYGTRRLALCNIYISKVIKQRRTIEQCGSVYLAPAWFVLTFVIKVSLLAFFGRIPASCSPCGARRKLFFLCYTILNRSGDGCPRLRCSHLHHPEFEYLLLWAAHLLQTRKELSYEDEALIYLVQQISWALSSDPKPQKAQSLITGKLESLKSWHTVKLNVRSFQQNFLLGFPPDAI